tara:strand:- start:520 stop:753 length:234 start_codon:yes stop_codon:yes gene_type:complete
MAKECFLEGDDYYDNPEDEYGCGRQKFDESNQVIVIGNDGFSVFPCNVYDRGGKLLRVEYPQKSEGVFKWKRWISRY